MLLAIDIGNTNIAFAVFDGEDIKGKWRIATIAARTSDEYAALIDQLFISAGLDSRKIQGIILANVVPEAQYDMVKMCKQVFAIEPMLVGSPKTQLGIQIEIDNTAEVGADRLVNAVEAWKRYACALIVVDFGTATTFDVISDQGSYIGGVIAPGINLSLSALHQAASKLPNVSVHKPQKAIGTSTISAMESGIYFGYIGLIDSIVSEIKAEYGQEMKVIATGGLAPLFSEACDVIEEVVDDLTIMGLNTIYCFNQ